MTKRHIVRVADNKQSRYLATCLLAQHGRGVVHAAGVEGYIEKPINPQTFVSEVERFLRRPAPSGAAA